ncbi:putative ring finger protein [Golovinomyces cichoracearum]|uniref:Putative ring finger protein n=1 Tax=Golovinomyces cichoracearum TaxID=62708 RepID=A0A420H6X4_9PEZI|nr:putative ring finger protein [Golovinomyces cichoracearum]
MHSTDLNLPQTSLSDSSSSPTRVRLRPLKYLRLHIHNSTHHLRHNTFHGSSQAHPLLDVRSKSPTSSSGSPGHSVTQNSSSPPTPATSQILSQVNSSRNINKKYSRAANWWIPTIKDQSRASGTSAGPRATGTLSSVEMSYDRLLIEPSEKPSVMSPSNLSSRETKTGTPPQNAGEVNTLNEDPISPISSNRLNVQDMANRLPSIRFSAHQDPRAQRPSLVFTPMHRILPSGKEVIKVGRYSEKDNQPVPSSKTPSSAPIGFKSKVVSRRHCEFWCYGGSWFIKDVKSSSGTFLNHIRLSAPGTESKPFQIHDGDIVQLGIDFKGGEEMIFRCVKIKLELNKEWQKGPNNFNLQSHRQLRMLNGLDNKIKGRTTQDCSICLSLIAPCQPLFVAPCSHTWHYKCIRMIINGPNWPHFVCPNCRNVADLEAELEEIHDEEWEEVKIEEKSADEGNLTELSSQSPEFEDNSPRANLSAKEPDPQEPEGLEANIAAGYSSTNLGEPSEDQLNQNFDELAYKLDRVQLDEPKTSVTYSHLETSETNQLAINIISRQHSETRALDRFAPQDSHTPSPEKIKSHKLNISAEGSLTPRNNVGPYLFEERNGGVRTTNISPMNLATVVEIPSSLSALSNTK